MKRTSEDHVSYALNSPFMTDDKKNEIFAPRPPHLKISKIDAESYFNTRRRCDSLSTILVVSDFICDRPRKIQKHSPASGAL